MLILNEFEIMNEIRCFTKDGTKVEKETNIIDTKIMYIYT